MKRLISSLLAVAFATSCSNTVSLSPSDRSLVSPTRVKNEVGLPEKLDYVDRDRTAAPLGSAQTAIAGPVPAEQNAVHNTLGERADRGSIILRDEFIKSLERSHAATVTESGQKSELTLTITKLGLLPTKSTSTTMQFELAVEATLADQAGRVIWQNQYGSDSVTDQLPARDIAAYKADNELLRRDFAVVCQQVSDLLVEDLKSQMAD